MAKPPRSVRNMPKPDNATFVGRIDLALERMGKKRRDLNAVVGMSSGYLAAVARRTGYKLGPERMANAAKFLGVDAHWLEHGGTPPVQLASNPKAVSAPRRGRDREFGQRLASAIAQSGKTTAEVNRALGLSSGYLAKIIKKGWHLSPDRLALAAELLGVDADWLDGDAGNAAAVLVPVKKANGATHPATNHASAASKLDASMHVSADTAMQSVWGLLAVDVKLFLIARANELLAQRLRAS
jgi:transcriptional regulator with XRE-family HTH domain